MGQQFAYWFSLICLLKLSAGYVKQGDGYMIGKDPNKHRVALGRGKYILEWQVNQAKEIITFNVTVETRGYVGFGLSGNGKMTGADIVIGGVMPSGSWYFKDRHAVANQLPKLDSKQDWTLHEARESNTHTFLSFSRDFDTCDSEEYPITEDKISIIWAFGQKDAQLAYHHNNRGVYDVYLLNPDYSPEVLEDLSATKHWSTKNGKYASNTNTLKVWTVNTVMELPERDTSYWCTMHKAPTLPGKHHVVGLDVRLPDSASRKHAHHLLLHKCNAPRGRSPRQMFDSYLHDHHPGQECLRVKSPTGPMPTEYCTEFYQSWAVGGRPIFHPPHVGIPVGSAVDEYYLLQIHFDNPNGLEGVLVNVSLDMFYTDTLRPHDGGLLMIRHESPGLTPSLHIPPSSIDHIIYGMCGAECTRNILPDEGISMYAMLLHSHNAGKQIRLQHFRGQTELPWVISDENYSFNYQQWRILTRETKIIPGDQLVVRCMLDNTGINGTVVGGFSTRQEMCVAFGYYYNKIRNFQQCSSEIDSPNARALYLGVGNVSWSNEHIEYIVTDPEGLKGKKITEVSDNLEWNLERREALQNFHLNHPHVNRCPEELYASEGGAGIEVRNLESVRKPFDATSEYSGDTFQERIVSYPFWAQPFTPKPKCSHS